MKPVIGDIVRISKCKNIFAKHYAPIWSEEVFVVKKVETNVLRTYVTSNLKFSESVETFYEKELRKNWKDKKWQKRKKEKAKNYILNRKVTIVLLTVGLIKKT